MTIKVTATAISGLSKNQAARQMQKSMLPRMPLSPFSVRFTSLPANP
jgi:hypothetical protein